MRAEVRLPVPADVPSWRLPLPDDVGCSLPLLSQELWVMHDLLQEADHLAFELGVGLKVLQEEGMGGLATVFKLSCSGLGPG